MAIEKRLKKSYMISLEKSLVDAVDKLRFKAEMTRSEWINELIKKELKTK